MQRTHEITLDAGQLLKDLFEAVQICGLAAQTSSPAVDSFHAALLEKLNASNFIFKRGDISFDDATYEAIKLLFRNLINYIIELKRLNKPYSLPFVLLIIELLKNMYRNCTLADSAIPVDHALIQDCYVYIVDYFLQKKDFVMMKQTLSEAQVHLDKISDKAVDYTGRMSVFHSHQALIALHKKNKDTARYHIAQAEYFENLNYQISGIKSKYIPEMYEQLALISFLEKKYQQAIHYYEIANFHHQCRIEMFNLPRLRGICRNVKMDAVNGIDEEEKRITNNQQTITKLELLIARQRYADLELLKSSNYFSLSLDKTSMKFTFKNNDDKILFKRFLLQEKVLSTGKKLDLCVDLSRVKPYKLLSANQCFIEEMQRDLVKPMINLLVDDGERICRSKEPIEEVNHVNARELQQKRHELNEQYRVEMKAKKSQASTLSTSSSSSSASSASSVEPAKFKKFTLNDSSLESKKLYPITSTRGKLAFSYISPEFKDELPAGPYEEKIINVIKAGNALGSENSQGMQGLVFFKKDKKLKQEDAGDCLKAKIQGHGGIGNYRPRAKLATMGMFRQVVDGKIVETPCEIYKWYKVDKKGHKS